MIKRALLTRAALVFAATTGVAACSSSGSDTRAGSALPATSAAPAASSASADNSVAALAPADILDRAETALQKAKSFHLRGTTTDDGSRVALDIEGDGSNATGVIKLDDVNLRVLEVGGKDYFRADKAGRTKLAGTDDVKAAAGWRPAASRTR